MAQLGAQQREMVDVTDRVQRLENELRRQTELLERFKARCPSLLSCLTLLAHTSPCKQWCTALSPIWHALSKPMLWARDAAAQPCQPLPLKLLYRPAGGPELEPGRTAALGGGSAAEGGGCADSGPVPAPGRGQGQGAQPQAREASCTAYQRILEKAKQLDKPGYGRAAAGMGLSGACCLCVHLL